MPKTYFVTGTDTEVGKTFVSAALLQAAANQGLTTAAVKPVAAGCEQTEEGLRNEDALTLQEAMTLELPYAQVNPVALEAPIAPHIAAIEEGRRLSISTLSGVCRGVMLQRAELTLIEGAGGWRVPLNGRETLADLPRDLDIPVILVVGMRLGCLNHALLTAEAIARDGLRLAGWVANRVTPEMSRYRENLLTLKGMLSAPCLGEIPYLEGGDWRQAATQLNLAPLLDN